jgi:hypothetical protein
MECFDIFYVMIVIAIIIFLGNGKPGIWDQNKITMEN